MDHGLGSCSGGLPVANDHAQYADQIVEVMPHELPREVAWCAENFRLDSHELGKPRAWSVDLSSILSLRQH